MTQKTDKDNDTTQPEMKIDISDTDKTPNKTPTITPAHSSSILSPKSLVDEIKAEEVEKQVF